MAITTTQAQRIDFNNGQNRTETGFTSWTWNLESSMQKTIEGLTITISRAEGSAGTNLFGEWWKDGVNKYSQLTSDGITVAGKTGDEKFTLRSGSAAIKMTINGFSAGRHSILAYHNNPAGFNGAPITVSVDGQTQVEGVVPTNRAQTPSACATSYIQFEATEGQPVTIIYQTVPDPAVNYEEGYNTTSFFINALVFDRPNPKTTASDPTPANNDLHFDFAGSLSWTPATSAVRHHLYMGTQPGQLSLVGTTTDSYLAGLTDINTSDTYYWRIDEEDADGNIYQGDEWTFRRARLAFPGAEGYGRFAIGGRGGTVYHVTSLDDDAEAPQPGTFRYGIKNVSGPRTIVFDVAGVISLKDRLVCSDPYVTVAGQTAPGRGIMFRDNPLGFSNDAVVRFLRMRLGYKQREDTSGRDGMGINGDHSIMDHCSIGWTIDEAFSSRGSKNVTLQRTLISEALNIADHPNYEAGKGHGYAATIGGDTGSYHHNLLAHNEGRNWSMAGGLDGSGAYAGHHDMFNNVCYNWGNRATDGGTHEGNFVGNYYKMGPATTLTYLLTADLEGTGSGTQAYYVSGNIRENLNGTQTHDALDNTYRVKAKQSYDWQVFVGQPFFESKAVVEGAVAAYQNVLSDVGCNQPALDNHDQRMISETILGTTSTKGSKSGLKGLIDRETDSEGFEGLNIVFAERPALFDQDADGIADWYEQARGWSTTAANNNEVTHADGYTNLEEYLNWLAEPHFFVKPNEDCVIDLNLLFAGYPSFSAATDILPATSATAKLNGKTLSIVATSEGLFTVTVTATDPDTGSSLSRTLHFYAASQQPDTETAIASQVAGRQMAGSEYFTLDGRRTLKPHNGIHIRKQYDASGTTQTTKVLIEN